MAAGGAGLSGCRGSQVGSSAVYGGNGCALHPEADVCTDSTCCQGWLSPEARKASWGDGALPCEKRVRQAVASTAGQVLTYDGAPIEVLYHASSGGQTEDAAEVFAMRVPYLQSVASPGEEGYDGYAREQRFTLTEAAAKLAEAFPDSSVEADALPAQLELLALTDTGRVKEMRVGSVTATLPAGLVVTGRPKPVVDTEAPEVAVDIYAKRAGILSRAGCHVSIITDCTVIPQQYLPLCAGMAVKAGMDPFDALRAITIHPAEHIGIADRVGSLEAGKDADLVITDGSPFEVSTTVRRVLIGGKTVHAV